MARSTRSRYARRPSPRGRSGGADNAPLYAVLAGIGVVLIVVLVFALAGGGSGSASPEEGTSESGVTPSSPSAGGPPPVVLKPFPEDVKRRIEAAIQRLDKDYDRAKALKDEGFRAQNRQDYEAAQKAWHEAYDLLRKMSGEVDLLLEPYGDDASDRVDRFLPHCARTMARWDRLMSDVYKYLK